MSPIPFADTAVLAPLQLMMVAIVAGLSCRQLSLGAASEFLTAAGVNVGVGLGFRGVARQLIKLVPLLLVTLPVSGAVAAAGTTAIGKSAEAYFFGTGKTA